MMSVSILGRVVSGVKLFFQRLFRFWKHVHDNPASELIKNFKKHKMSGRPICLHEHWKLKGGNCELNKINIFVEID
jgi:hypothetical protein